LLQCSAELLVGQLVPLLDPFDVAVDVRIAHHDPQRADFLFDDVVHDDCLEHRAGVGALHLRHARVLLGEALELVEGDRIAIDGREDLVDDLGRTPRWPTTAG
jgi:hypothetical protein